MSDFKPTLTFEVLIDEKFTSINTDPKLTPVDNKKVLSLINDYEEGDWRYAKFQNFVWDNIAETALTSAEREVLINHSLLTAAARNLRLTDKDAVGEGSELAEVVLYAIMKHHYGALPVVPKIFHKQNTQDNAKGSDSVHIVLEGDRDFSVWFGEAKFYSSIEDARLGPIITSVNNALQKEKLKKENSFITDLAELDRLIPSADLKKQIRETLSNQASIDELKSKLHIPILLLYECAITKRYTEISPTYKEEIIAYHKNRAQAYFTKQIGELSALHKYSEINFHIILFPVPSKARIVERFVSNVKHYQGQ